MEVTFSRIIVTYVTNSAPVSGGIFAGWANIPYPNNKQIGATREKAFL
jgi:hypothetical protein